jgi:Zn-dependent metalloprotease
MDRFRSLRAIAAPLALVGLFLSNAANAEPGKIYINGQWVTPKAIPNADAFTSSIFDSDAPVDLKGLALSFLDHNASLLNAGVESQWIPVRHQTSPGIQTERVQRIWKGLEVVGGDAVVHFSQGKILFANADATYLEHLSTNPRLSAEEASSMAFASYRGRAKLSSRPQLKVLVLDEGSKREAHLAYEVTVHDQDKWASDIHFIDAQNGQELMVTTNVHTLDRQVLSGSGDNSDFELDDSTWKLIYADKGCDSRATGSEGGFWNLRRNWNSFLASDAEDSSGPTSCQTLDNRVMSSALSAWNNSGLVHSYYKEEHARDSFDGRGVMIKSVVNFGGESFPNAAWYNEKSVMLYGFGDDATFNDFASPLDVVAHEITHAVTSHSSSLEYVNESGALNESYSDVFGMLIAFKFGKASDWKLGKSLFKDGKRFVRDMENPTIGHNKDFRYRGQPCNRFNDFCGVHSNSGIPNRAAVMIAKKIGLEKLGKIYYLTLTQLLRSDSGFSEARAQTEAACAQLYGQGNADCQAVSEAFSAVGIELAGNSEF